MLSLKQKEWVKVFLSSGIPYGVTAHRCNVPVEDVQKFAEELKPQPEIEEEEDKKK